MEPAADDLSATGRLQLPACDQLCRRVHVLAQTARLGANAFKTLAAALQIYTRCTQAQDPEGPLERQARDLWDANQMAATCIDIDKPTSNFRSNRPAGELTGAWGRHRQKPLRPHMPAPPTAGLLSMQLCSRSWCLQQQRCASFFQWRYRDTSGAMHPFDRSLDDL